MAAGGAARVVGERKGQRSGSSVSGGRWKEVVVAAGAANASQGNANDDAPSCGTEDLQVLEMGPARMTDSSSEQLAVVAVKKTVEQTAATPIMLDVAVSSSVSADDVTCEGKSAREKRTVAADSVSKELDSSQGADKACVENGGTCAAEGDGGASATIATTDADAVAGDAGTTDSIASTNANTAAGDARGEQSGAEADTERRTDGSCSTDVSTATTVASGDKDTPAVSSRKRRRTHSGLTQEDIDKQLGDLGARAEEKRAYLAHQEAIHTRGRERVAQLKRELKELTAAVDRCLVKKREHRRIECLMRGHRRERDSDDDNSGSESSSSSSSSSSESSISSSSKERRKRRQTSSRSVDRDENEDTKSSRIRVAYGVVRAPDSDGEEQQDSQQKRKRRKKTSMQRERRRLRRFRDDLALRFQLLQSECQRSELQVDKLVADLRREYMDSYLFAGAEFP